MGTKRIIFYSIFAAYQLVAFVFTVIIDNNNMATLLKLASHLSAFKYLAFVGVVLVAVDFAWAWKQKSLKPGT